MPFFVPPLTIKSVRITLFLMTLSGAPNYDQEELDDNSLPGLDENQALFLIDKIEGVAGLRDSVSVLNDIITEINSQFPSGYDEFTDFITSSICGIFPPNQEWVTYEFFKLSLNDDTESPDYVRRFKTAMCVIATRDLQYLGPYSTSKPLNKTVDGETNTKINKFRESLANRYEELIASTEDGVPLSTISIELSEISAILSAHTQIQETLGSHLSADFKDAYREMELDFTVVSDKNYLARAEKVLSFLKDNAECLHFEDARLAAEGVIKALSRKLDAGRDEINENI